MGRRCCIKSVPFARGGADKSAGLCDCCAKARSRHVRIPIFAAQNKNLNRQARIRFLCGGELSPLYELRKSDIGAVSLDCFSVSFTDSIDLLCFLSGSEK